jgi:hypothetical protein
MTDRDPKYSEGRWLGYVVIAAMIFWALVGYAIAQTIRHDTGGAVVAYMVKAVGQEAPDRIDGLCASACTIYLSTACVTPRSRLIFHAASVNGVIHKEMTRAMAGFYPAPLRAWFMDGPAHSLESVELSGAQVIALGVKSC